MGDKISYKDSIAPEFDCLSDEIDKIIESVTSADHVIKTENLEVDLEALQTSEQKTRDRQISELLEQYLLFFRDKVESNRRFKKILFYFCLFIIFVFSASFLVFLVLFFSQKKNCDITATTQFIFSCVTFLSLIFGIMTIITKYVFPVGDESHITRIVELIQQNDLKHKIENLKYKNKY